MARTVAFSLCGIAAGWGLDRWGWPPSARGRRRSLSAAAMVALASGAFGSGSVAVRSPIPAALAGGFLALMAAMAVIDASARVIPNRLLYPAGLAALGAVPLAGPLGLSLSLPAGLAGMVGYAGPLLAVALARPRAMGMGDVKLAALIGLVLGSIRLEAVWIAAVAAALAGGAGAAGVMVARPAGRAGTIPYGPFLVLGAAVAVLRIGRIG